MQWLLRYSEMGCINECINNLLILWCAFTVFEQFKQKDQWIFMLNQKSYCWIRVINPVTYYGLVTFMELWFLKPISRYSFPCMTEKWPDMVGLCGFLVYAVYWTLCINHDWERHEWYGCLSSPVNKPNKISMGILLWVIIWKFQYKGHVWIDEQEKKPLLKFPLSL